MDARVDVVSGAMLPFAVAAPANTAIPAGLCVLATIKRPELSSARGPGEFSRVAAPLMVRLGVRAPFSVEALSKIRIALPAESDRKSLSLTGSRAIPVTVAVVVRLRKGATFPEIVEAGPSTTMVETPFPFNA